MTGPHGGGNEPPYQQPQFPPQQGYPPPPQPAPWGEPQPQPAPWGQPPPTAWDGQSPPQAPPPWPGGGPPEPPAKRGLAGKLWPKIAGGLGVLLVVCAVGAVRAVMNSDDDGGKAYPTSSPPSGVGATSTATAKAGGPFAGTPAEKYPEGAAGITLPKAAAAGPFTAKQVGDALAAVKKALVAGRLDKRMLVDRKPDAFLKLLAPDAKTLLRKDFSSDKFSVYATQFAPGVKPASQQPRVKGRVTYKAAKTEGIRAIQVTTNFVWVYPFKDDVVVVHDELVWMVLHPSDVETSSRGLWFDHGQFYASNMDCDEFDKGLIAPGKPEIGVGTDNQDPNSMFDPNRTLDVGNSC
jgi:hypothetical protein